MTLKWIRRWAKCLDVKLRLDHTLSQSTDKLRPDNSLPIPNRVWLLFFNIENYIFIVIILGVNSLALLKHGISVRFETRRVDAIFYQWFLTCTSPRNHAIAFSVNKPGLKQQPSISGSVPQKWSSEARAPQGLASSWSSPSGWTEVAENTVEHG